VLLFDRMYFWCARCWDFLGVPGKTRALCRRGLRLRYGDALLIRFTGIPANRMACSFEPFLEAPCRTSDALRWTQALNEQADGACRGGIRNMVLGSHRRWPHRGK